MELFQSVCDYREILRNTEIRVVVDNLLLIKRRYVMRNMSIKSLFFLSIVTLVLGGCATSRSVVDVRVSPGPNPANGKAVKILQIIDSRKFEVAPRTQSVPSLNEEEIKDSKITSRAVGRKRNGYGKAMGDFMLPEQRTVQDLVREAMTKALREKGYSVVEQNSVAYQNALPLEADIGQLWVYMTPGFWSLTLEFETILKIKGNVFPTSNEEQIRGYAQMSTQVGTESNYIETIQNGIEDFIKNFKEKLKSATSN
jgi:hypothetical protein